MIENGRGYKILANQITRTRRFAREIPRAVSKPSGIHFFFSVSLQPEPQPQLITSRKMAVPEAQAWAEIGINVTQEKQPAVPEPVTSADLPTAGEADATKAAERDEDANSEVQLHVDEDAEPFQVDDAIENEPEPEADDKEGPSTSPKGEGDSQPQDSKDSKEKGSDEIQKSRDRDLDDDSDIPQKTNSGNPKMIRARIFVGHLNTEKAARKDVEDLFAPFGNVLGVSLQNGYGFVQYELEEEAKKAIKELHGTHFCGMRMG